MAIEIPMGQRRRFVVERGDEDIPGTVVNYATNPPNIIVSVTVAPTEPAGTHAMFGLAVGTTELTFTYQGQTVTETVNVTAVEPPPPPDPLTIRWGEPEPHA
jgi:hypothetical protein